MKNPSYRIRLYKITSGRNVYGKITQRGRDICVYVNYDPSVPRWRRMLALIHEILHLIDFVQSSWRDHYKLHLTAILALLYAYFGVGKGQADFRFLFKAQPVFTTSEIQYAIKLYRTFRKHFE